MANGILTQLEFQFLTSPLPDAPALPAAALSAEKTQSLRAVTHFFLFLLLLSHKVPVAAAAGRETLPLIQGATNTHTPITHTYTYARNATLYAR